jgi:1-phosphofructokinase
MILAVALSPSVDHTYVVDALVPGTIHWPRETVRLAGGNGLNVARAAQALGADVAAVAIVGGPNGRWIASSLETEGIAFGPVIGRGNTRLRTSLTDQSGALTELYESPTAIDVSEWDALEDAIAGAIVQFMPSWLVVSGLLPPGAPAEAITRLVAIAGEAGARIAVDTADIGVRQALAAGADLVTVSAVHAAALLDASDVRDLAGLGEGLGKLAATDETAIVVIDGRDGVWASFPELGPIALPPADLGRYRLGCGDVFVAGLVRALEQGATPTAALDSAASASEANSRIPGAGRLDAS